MDVDMKSPIASAAGGDAFVGGPNVSLAVLPSAETYLVTLPRELVLDIIKHCVPPRPPYNNIRVNRITAISQLSLVDKSLREMCIPTLFRSLKLRTGHSELLGHIQVLENNRILEIVQHLRIVSTTWDDATPQWESDVASRLARLIGRMPNLRELNLILPWGKELLAAAVQDGLVKQRIVIPTVEQFRYDLSNLSPDPRASVSFIPSVFTGLRALHLDLRIRASPKNVPGLSTIASSLRLHTLSLHHEYWGSEDIMETYELFPNISSLIIGGEVWNAVISDLIPTFKKFRKLRSLAVTDLISIDDEDLGDFLHVARKRCPCEDCFTNDNMDLVWREGQEGACGCLECSFTGGHYGEALHMARENHPLAEDQKENVGDIFRECPDLEVLYFQTTWSQATRYTPVRDETGVSVRYQHNELVDWPAISEQWKGA